MDRRLEERKEAGGNTEVDPATVNAIPWSFDQKFFTVVEVKVKERMKIKAGWTLGGKGVAPTQVHRLSLVHSVNVTSQAIGWSFVASITPCD